MSNQNQITVFAETTFRNQNRKFGIKVDDRRRHMYIIGKSGMGKSTVMENMIVEDIRSGKGVAVVDPHGDLAEKIIEFIPPERINDVVYFNPSDTNFPIAFNIMESVDPHYRHLVASGLIGVFRKLWADSWGPRLEYILRNTILAVLDYPGSTLMSVTRMLADKAFRKKVVDNIQDPVVKSFWVKEFAGYADKFASEAVAPIQNKVGQFLSSSLIRNIVGQVESSIDIRQIMDEKKILIMNMSKGRIGEDNTQLLGAMMITKIQLAAMSRVDIPEKEREDFYLYVDEFQNFATESFATILSEARKYRLNLIMGHQYIEQLTDEVRAAVFGNVGTLVVFRVGAPDAEALVKEFTPIFTEEDLVNLPKYNCTLKLMIDGVASDPFSARGLPPLQEYEKTGTLQAVIEASRAQFANPREEVESLIAKWHEDDPLPKRDAPPSTNSPQSGQAGQAGLTANAPLTRQAIDSSQAANGWPAECVSCGKEVILNFEPDGVRPVFCKTCLAKSKEDRRLQAEQRKGAKQNELARLQQRQAVKAPASTTKEGQASSAHSTATRPAATQSATPAPVVQAKELSLSELASKAPVDFRGKPITITARPDGGAPTVAPDAEGVGPDAVSSDEGTEGAELADGQEVVLN